MNKKILSSYCGPLLQVQLTAFESRIVAGVLATVSLEEIAENTGKGKIAVANVLKELTRVVEQHLAKCVEMDKSKCNSDRQNRLK